MGAPTNPTHGHGLFSATLTVASVAFVALALGWAGPKLDTPSDPISSIAASRLADADECRAQHGPHAVAIELPDGSHRCADKHGRRFRNQTTVATAKGMTP